MRFPGRPIICLVTDRSRLPYPREHNLILLAAAAASAGVDLIQVRERDLDDRRLFSLTTRIVAAAAGTDAAVVVNDRADVAIAAGASGVHLRSDSVPTVRVRTIAPAGFLVGRSIHSAAEAAAESAAGVDYLLMGTVHPTPSKPSGTAIAGVEGLRAACRASAVPVIAIGGISAENAGEIGRSGAAGIAAITLFASVFKDGTGQEGVRPLEEIVARVRAAWSV
jgi:thiamine-phosphate pyrophosphorylase